MTASDQDFDLFDHEKRVIARAARFLEDHADDADGMKATVRALIEALEQGARGQRQLIRTGDRQQEQLRLISRELKEKSRLLEEQAGNLLALNAVLAREVEARSALEVELRLLASTDPLTGVCNRRHFHELGDHERTRELRLRQGLSLLALDLDLFKSVNDTHGHVVGDRTLVRFAQVCRKCVRTVDIVGRTGGEEFAILLPHARVADSAIVAERIRAAVAECQMTGPNGPFHVTVSIGAAQFVDGESLEELMARADRQLYAAKHAGRNRIHADMRSDQV